jgi:hypothetical protein
MTIGSVSTIAATAVALLLATVPVSAQVPGTEAAQREAQRRFRAGVELYRDGDAAAAAVEFRSAYDLAPNYRVLYNLGQVAYQLHDWVGARSAFQRYLDEGTSEVAEPRRHEVEQTLATLAQRIGTIVVEGGAGEELRVDDVKIGRAPLATPVEANVGPRKVSWTDAAGSEVTRVVEVVGGESARVRIPPRLAVADRRARADARVDAAAPRRLPEPPQARNLWLPWTATAVLAAGGATAAVVAARASQDLQNARGEFPASMTEIDRLQHRTRLWAAVADGLFIGAAVFASVSLYLTIAGDDETTRTRPRRNSISIAPNGFVWRGDL